MVETTISRGDAEAAENCTAIGVSCARLLSAASAPPREAFFTGSACRRSSASRRFAPLRPSRASTRAWPRAPTPELQGHLKEAQHRRTARRRARMLHEYRLQPTRRTPAAACYPPIDSASTTRTPGGGSKVKAEPGTGTLGA